MSAPKQDTVEDAEFDAVMKTDSNFCLCDSCMSTFVQARNDATLLGLASVIGTELRARGYQGALSGEAVMRWYNERKHGRPH